ncbi:serine protein kinase RIO [Candidatus Woesearchaeota archaeon]|nr:serine protein kinase RIO [Candidatus Woesearchaeota archaeon]
MAKRSIEKFKIYKNVFDEFTLRTLFKLSSQEHFENLVSPIMIGKESNIFLAETMEQEYVIVKIYRLHSCNFNQMFSYIQSDPRYANLKNQRRLVIFHWVQREYRNLLLAREKINVPQPIAFSNNVLVMESIGGDKPSPQLKDSLPKDLDSFSKKILKSVRELASLGLVHADLSEYNILNHKETPYFIDFSQGTSIKDPNSSDYLKRDLKNIARFFAKHKVTIDPEEEYKRIVEKKNS